MLEDDLSSGIPEEYKFANKVRRRSSSEPLGKEVPTEKIQDPVKALLRIICDIPKPKNVAEIDVRLPKKNYLDLSLKKNSFHPARISRLCTQLEFAGDKEKICEEWIQKIHRLIHCD